MGHPLSQTPGALRKRAWRERVEMGHPHEPDSRGPALGPILASARTVMGCRAWGIFWTRKTSPGAARVFLLRRGVSTDHVAEECCAARATARGRLWLRIRPLESWNHEHVGPEARSSARRET